MKLTKNSNLLFVALTLVLSLVSFTGASNHTPKESVKTALIVSDYRVNAWTFISYQKALKHHFDALTRYTASSFEQFQKTYNLKDSSAFKTYTNETLGLSTEQQQIKFALSTHQILYNSITS